MKRTIAPLIAKALTLSGFVASITFTANPAQAYTITFDSVPGGGTGYYSIINPSYSEGGYNFSPVNFSGGFDEHIGDGTSIANTLNWHSGGNNNSTVGFDLSSQAGGLFDLSSLTTYGTSLEISANYGSGFVGLGTYNGGNGTFTALNVTNVQTVRFIDSNGSGVGIDNVNVAAVPEPLTILGSIAATGFLAGFERKLAKGKKDKKDD